MDMAKEYKTYFAEFNKSKVLIRELQRHLRMIEKMNFKERSKKKK